MKLPEGRNRRIGLAPVPKVGQTYDGAVSNWHSYLHGMQTVVQIMEGIGAMPNHQMPPAGDEEQPFEHAIDPRLSEARKDSAQGRWPEKFKSTH